MRHRLEGANACLGSPMGLCRADLPWCKGAARSTRLLGGVAMLALLSGVASAQQTPVPTPVAASAPSENAMVNLIRALEAQGVLSADKGDLLLRQAENEAAAARATSSTPPPGTVRVPYVPESVRAQIRDELKDDVIQQAKAEGWATPGQGRVQPWVSNVRLFGDFRYRAQFNFFARDNNPEILDFNAFNANGPTEINFSQGAAPPILNTTRDRNNLENFRLRFGLAAKINDWADLTVRLAGGDTNSPVSTSTTLGGGFVKKAIYIDQAYAVLHPIANVSLTGGRMPNPFYSYDVIWDPDLNFDGVAAAAGHDFGDLRVSGVAGAFPFEYGADTFPTTSFTGKQRSANKWLYAAQLVGNYQFRHDIGLKVGGAYYHFTNVQGTPSDPCETYISGTQCTTDQSRPAFLQKGNTVFAFRNIFGPPGSTNFSQRQFVGLTFNYHIVDVNADLTVKLDDKKAVTVGGDYIKNLAFDRNAICKTFAGFQGTPAAYQPPLNNRRDTNTCLAAGNDPSFNGGDVAWMARVSVGYPAPKKQGEWNVFAAYKYIQSDAVLDSLVDNDFHLGGTNAKGYVLAGTYGLYDNVTTRIKYQSANEIVGPHLGIDVLQLDFLVAF